MIFTHDHTVNSSGLTLINTAISQGHPGHFRRFRIPTRYRDWEVPSAGIGCDLSSETANQDGPFIVDPTQAFIVLQLLGIKVPTSVCIILRTQALIEHACSMGAETYIPWEEWGRDANIMEMPTSNPAIYIQGVHLIETERRGVLGGDIDVTHVCLRIFDFSKRGCSTPFDEGGEAVQEVWYRGGRELLLQGSENVNRIEFGSLGRSVFYSLVSCLCHWKTGVG